MSATATKSTALEILQRHESALSNETRERWALEQLVTVWNTVAEGASFGEFAMFISLADRYDLNPLAHEIWFNKSTKTGKVMIMVGRDGLLTIARRYADFSNVRGDVHRKKDNFKVIHLADGTDTVEHSYSGSTEERGEIVGSWAQIIHSDGTATNFTYTPMEEYGPWDRIKQRSAMIQKCSVSLALRIAYGISGVVGEDEVSDQITQSLTTAAEEGGDVTEEVEFPPEVEAIIFKAEQLGVSVWANQNTWKYRVAMGGDVLASAIAEANAKLSIVEQNGDKVTEADVVETRKAPLQKLEDSESLGGGVSSPTEGTSPYRSPSDTEGSVEGEPVAQESSERHDREDREAMNEPALPEEKHASAIVKDPDLPFGADPGDEARSTTHSPYKFEDGDSEEMRQLKMKGQYVKNMEAVGEEEEAQKDEALDMIDDQIKALKAREAQQSLL